MSDMSTREGEHAGFALILSPDRTHAQLTLDADRQPVAIDPDALRGVIAHLRALQNRIEWHYAWPQERYIRVKSRSKRENKWHLFPFPHNSALCSQGPSVHSPDHEITPAGSDLWDGTVCKQCVFLWEQQIQMGIVCYHPQSSTQSQKEA